MSAQHTPAPWEFVENDENYLFEILQKNFVGNVKLHIGEIDQEDDARRIVACVNACAGFSNEQLDASTVTGGLSAMMDRYRAALAQVEQQSADLANKLRISKEHINEQAERNESLCKQHDEAVDLLETLLHWHWTPAPRVPRHVKEKDLWPGKFDGSLGRLWERVQEIVKARGQS